MASVVPQDEWTHVATNAVSSSDAPAVLEDLRLLAEQMATWGDPAEAKATSSRPSGSSRGDSSCDERLGLRERDPGHLPLPYGMLVDYLLHR